jgi:hypothetical protein
MRLGQKWSQKTPAYEFALEDHRENSMIHTGMKSSSLLEAPELITVPCLTSSQTTKAPRDAGLFCLSEIFRF